jgi:hypothetical protein
VIRLRSGEGQAGTDILFLEIGKIGEYLDLAHPGSD